MKSSFYVALVWLRDAVDPANARLWEECLFLVAANDEIEAKQKAEAIARRNESQYISATGKTVEWTFDCVHDVRFLEGEPANGLELYSRFMRPSEIESLKRAFDDDDID